MSRKISVTIPDEMVEAAYDHAEVTCRTVPNLCVYALRVMLNKHNYQIPQLDALQTSATGDPGKTKQVGGVV